MEKRIFGIAVILCVLAVIFQQCSVGGSDSVGDLSQPSVAGDLPTVTVDNAALALSSTSNFSVGGTCDTKGNSSYIFVVRFQESGVSSPAVTTFNSPCNNGRYNLLIVPANLGMRSGFPGTLTIRLSVDAGEGTGANVSITWTGTSTTGTSTTGTSTSGTTTSGTSTGTTTGTTGCPRTDGTCSLASDPFTAFGGGCCRNGGWWMCDNPSMPACSGGSSSGGSTGGTSSSGTTTGGGVNCPTTDGTCNMANDPFVAFGGGCCRDGGFWMCNNPAMPACP